MSRSVLAARQFAYREGRRRLDAADVEASRLIAIRAFRRTNLRSFVGRRNDPTEIHRPYRALADDDFEGALLELALAIALDLRPRNSRGRAGRPGHPGPGLDLDASGYRANALRDLEAVR